MRRARSSLLLTLAAFVPACARPTAASPTSTDSPAPIPFVTPSYIAPDVLPASHLVSVLPDGSRRYLVSGIRVLERPDGSREQAKTRLPAGLYRAMDLPSRLGGGLLFVASAGGTTLLYRADGWLEELSPFSRLQEASRELVAGFDRLYLRLQRGDEWIALDPKAGTRVPLGPFPLGPRVGPMGFADAWRAVAVVDLRGPMATFDAGASWRTISLEDSPITAVVRDGDDLVLGTRSFRHRLGPEGEIFSEAMPSELTLGVKSERFAQAPPAGHSLLRAAVEDGWPDSLDTVLLAREGALYRIRLRDGAVLSSNRRAYDPSIGPCHATALGSGFGFVCGSPHGETSIQAFEPPLRMREIRRFSDPRVVLPSGTGGIAVRGGCAAPGDLKTRYCLRTREGKEREIELPATESQRIVVLADGRVAAVVPPKKGIPGQLSFFAEDAKATTLPLELGEAGKTFEDGVLLEGLEEREPDSLGGWLDTGDAVRGIRIGLDGKVTISPIAVETGSTIVSGRFALALGSGSHRARESTDGGFTFRDVDLPPNLPRATLDSRACGPVGCVAGGWLRVGWGEADGKMAISPEPVPVTVPRARGLSLVCEATGEVSNPPPLARPTPPPAPRHPLRDKAGARALPSPSATKANWIPFGGAAPPSLESGELGFDSGTDPANLRVLVPLRVYAWGPRGADWSRSGRFLARFDDRFRVQGLRATAITESPFADEEQAAGVLDFQGGPPVVWNAIPDASGDAAVVLACRSGSCTSFGAMQGRPAIPFRGLEVTSASDVSAARLGEAWFVLAPPAGKTAQQELALFRIDGGNSRILSTFPRAWAGREDSVRLVRRSSSEGLGLLTLGAPDLERGARDWFVLPLDPETGTLGEPIRLYGNHLEGDSPLCEGDVDGWLVDAQPSPSPALRVIADPSASVPTLTSSGVRLRLEPGRACIEALSARGENLSTLKARSGPTQLPHRSSIPLTAIDMATGLRYGLRCDPH